MDVIQELSQARERITALETTIAQHVATISSNATEISVLTAARDSITAERDGLQTSLNERTTELATANSNLQARDTELATVRADVARLNAEARTAEQRALELTGKGGNRGVKGGGGNRENGSTPTTKQEAIAGYNAISDPTERAKYYNAHKALILG